MKYVPLHRLNLIIFPFTEKYDYVGRLLRPGEKPTNYSDEEDESESSKAGNKPDDILNVSASDVSSPTEKSKDD